MGHPDFDMWVDQVGKWQEAIREVPVAVRQDIISKGRLKMEEPAHGIRSLLEDPLSVQYAMGYKDRRYSLTYDVLKRIPSQVSIIAAILQTRCNQIAAFSVPFRSSKSVGYVIKHKDPSHATTKSEMQFIKDLETFIYNCGWKEPNPHNKNKRDDFETFLKKITRDSLTYDQACVEIIPDRRGVPYEFLAVDAATVRLAADTSIMGLDSYHSRRPVYNSNILAGLNESNVNNPYRMLKLYDRPTSLESKPAFVQVLNGQICNVYTHSELAFGVRNPRSDIYINGYGYGELEQLVSIVTAHLYAEEYNRRFFSQGSSPKGILSFKGDAMTPDQLEGFRRQWRSMLEGVENSWKTPILQSEQGVDWIDLHPSNREMEYGQWLEYLLKIICGVYLIDPAELNFDLHGGVQQTPLFESSQEWKLKASRDRGLKPLLRFIAKMINEHVISKIDDHFVFDFSGLDELTEQEKHTLRTEQISSYLTLNEVRKEEDLPEIPYGDVPLNPAYTQLMQIQQQMEQQQQQQQAAPQGAGGQPGQPSGQPGQEEGQGAGGGSAAPQYADNFTKSISLRDGEKFLEIDLSELDSFKDKIYG